MKNLKDIVKSFFDGDGQEASKKRIQNLAIFMIIGIALLLVGGFFTNNDCDSEIENTNSPSQEFVVNEQDSFDEYDRMLQTKIKNILSQIDGVGMVEIAVTYAAGQEIVPAQDVKLNESNTKEQDREGGVRNTNQTDTDNKVVIGSQEVKPVILKVIPPQVQGVIVVAEGAKNDVVKVDISNAVSTLLGISLSKVEVFPMTN